MTQRYFPISGLTTYVARWVIKARIVEKSEKKDLKNSNSVFHVDLVDEEGDVIRAKFWGKSAEKWDPTLEKGKVYTFKKGKITVANKRFSNLPHPYELSFDTDAEIHIVEDDGNISNRRSYSFVTLRDVRNSTREMPFMVDILGVVRHIGPITKVTTKRTGDELSRRVMTVVDDSEFEFEITLWNQMAESLDVEAATNKVVCMNDIQVKEWNGGRSGQSSTTTEINLNATDAKAEKLRQWHLVNGDRVKFVSMNGQSNGLGGTALRSSNFEELDVANIRKNCEDDKREGNFIFTGRLRRMYTRSKEGELRMLYPACPKCRKKVISVADDQWNCVACNETLSEPVYRYMFGAVFCDYSDQLMLRMFHDQSIQLIGVDAEKIHELNSRGEKDVLDELLTWDNLFQQVRIILKAKQDNYNGEDRVQYVALKTEPLDFHSSTINMLSKIREKIPNATSFHRSRKVRRVDDMETDSPISERMVKKNTAVDQQLDY